jgi:hypothetical protein
MSEIVHNKFNTLRGHKNLSSNDKYEERTISIENLVACIENDHIIIPSFQRDIDNNKIQKMIKTYEKNKDTFFFQTNAIQLAKLIDDDDVNILYLIDGQHRVQMYIELHKKNKVGHLKIVTTNCGSIEEMKEIYVNMNRDNINIIKKFSQEEIKDDLYNKKYNVLQNIFKKNYKHLFTNNKKINTFIFDIEEFISKLKDIKLFSDNGYNNVDNALQFLLNKNDKFYKAYYLKLKVKKSESNKILTKEEELLINQNKIFTLRKNNYFDFLTCDSNEEIIFQFSHRNKLVISKSNNI